jgi:hypothetical protein
MSVKVVQGLIGEVKAPSAQVSANQQNTLVSSHQAVAAVTNAATQAYISSEAVSVSVRSKSSGTTGKIKDYKEAKEVTDSVADRIKTDGEAKDAHSGLSPSSGAALV